MRRTKALILVATLAVLTSVAACSWQAEPLPAESAQSEFSLSISEFATQETAEKELEEVRHSLNDCKSRTQKLNKQKRKYIAYLKKAEQIMLEKNQNHIPRID